MNRRNFFQTITAAVAAPLVPSPAAAAPLVPSPAAAAPLVPSPAAAAETGVRYLQVTPRELIHSSMRLLGLLRFHEVPAAQEERAALFALGTLDPSWWSIGVNEPVTMAAPTFRVLRRLLAQEIAPEFGVEGERGWNLALGIGSGYDAPRP